MVDWQNLWTKIGFILAMSSAFATIDAFSGRKLKARLSDQLFGMTKTSARDLTETTVQSILSAFFRNNRPRLVQILIFFTLCSMALFLLVFPYLSEFFTREPLYVIAISFAASSIAVAVGTLPLTVFLLAVLNAIYSSPKFLVLLHPLVRTAALLVVAIAFCAALMAAGFYLGTSNYQGDCSLLELRNQDGSPMENFAGTHDCKGLHLFIDQKGRYLNIYVVLLAEFLILSAVLVPLLPILTFFVVMLVSGFVAF